MKLPFKKLHAKDRGQAILIIALAMVGIVAFVGMMLDGGVLFIEYGKLKRGIDAASIASAQQFRKGFQGADLAAAAQNFLTLNDTRADNINIYRCGRTRDGDGQFTVDLPTDGNGYLLDQNNVGDGTKPDNDLCPQGDDPIRKLVRVEAEKWVNFSFLRIVGWNGMTIRADSVGEAASIDLVLVIDTSASMSYDTGGELGRGDNPADDPAVCNFSVSTPCQPLADIKNVATTFIGTMFFPYDRVAIVASTGQPEDSSSVVTRDHQTVLELSDDEDAVEDAIAGLKVFQPARCSANPAYGPCLNDDAGGNFIGIECPLYRSTGDPSSCNSSNIGGSLYRAEGVLRTEPMRSDSFWVIILLAGGPANATDTDENSPEFGYCPETTWDLSLTPFCRDASNSTRHEPGDTDADGNYVYDADDYARDAGDFVADPVDGQGISIFTIGWGDLVQNARQGDPDSGEALLEYIATEAGDGEDKDGDGELDYTANHGLYFYADNINGLGDVFEKIADNIFTRIAR